MHTFFCQDGCDIPIEVWEDSSFVLPFRLSAELNCYGPDLSEMILQKPLVEGTKTKLYLEFEENTEFVLR